MSPLEQEQRILGYGNEAVNRPIDAILDDAVAADPLQKGGKKKRKIDRCKASAGGSTLVIVAGGWKYATVEDEIFAIKPGHQWKPTTADFKRMAEMEGDKPLLASSPEEFFKHIANQPDGSVGRVVFIGHGGSGIVFSGDAGGFNGGKQLGAGDLPGFQADIDNKIKPKLRPNAKIDLVTCYVGGNKQFMDALTNAIDRCVRGFTSAVEVRKPAVKDKTITERGFSRILGQKTYRRGWRHLRLQIAVEP
jgi:hypothetical protein